LIDGSATQTVFHDEFEYQAHPGKKKVRDLFDGKGVKTIIQFVFSGVNLENKKR